MPDKELQLTIRAVDEASRIVKGIGAGLRTFGALAKRTFQGAAQFAKGFLQRLTSIRTFLTGAFLATLTALTARITGELAVAAKTFAPLFSPEQQRNIDRVATALNRLKASLLSTFGRLVAAGSEGIVETLDRISSWLRDNQDEIRDFLRGVVEFLREVKDIFRVLAQGRVSLRDLIFGRSGEGGDLSGSEILGIEVGILRREDLIREAARELTEALRLTGTSVVDLVSRANEIRADLLNAVRAGGFEGPSAAGGDTAFELARQIVVLTEAYGDTAAATALKVKLLGDAEGDFAAVLKDANRIIRDHNERLKDAGKGIVTETIAVKEAAKAWKDYRVTVEQTNPVLESISGVLTDNVINTLEAIVDGTKKVGAAFQEMVANILRELARLLLQDALFKLFLSLLRAIGSAFTPDITLSDQSFAATGNTGLPGAASLPGGGIFSAPELGGGRFGGGGGGSITVNQVVNGGNPDEVKRATRDGIMQALDESRAVRRKVQSVARGATR